MSNIQAYWLSSCGDMDLDPNPDSDSWCNYDAAQSELAALREELAGYRAANMVLRDELKTERLRADAAVGDANDAERSLAAAEQRNSELTQALERGKLWVELFRSWFGDYGVSAEDHQMIIRTLRSLPNPPSEFDKPTESGASID